MFNWHHSCTKIYEKSNIIRRKSNIVLFVRKDLEDFMEIFYEQQEIVRIEIREKRNILILLDLLSNTLDRSLQYILGRLRMGFVRGFDFP